MLGGVLSAEDVIRGVLRFGCRVNQELAIIAKFLQ
jgi:hypothetical protein